MERTILILFIMVFLAGGVFYERYLEDQGKIGPVGQILDMGGLSDLAEKAGIVRDVKRRSFRMRVRSQYEAMNEKLDEIEHQRAQFVQKRGESLKDLALQDNEFRAQVESYVKLIEGERTRFLATYPDFERYVQDLSGLSLDAAAVRRSQVNLFKEDVTRVLKSFPDDIAVDRREIDALLSKIEGILQTNPEAEQVFCVDFRACLSENFFRLESILTSAAGRMFDPPENEARRLVMILNDFEKEYLTLSENYQADERLINSNRTEINQCVHDLSTRLVTIGENEVHSLMARYAELLVQQDVIYQNLSLAKERIRDNMNLINRQYALFAEHTQKIPAFNNPKFSRKLEEIMGARKDLFAQFDLWDLRITGILSSRRNVDYDLLGDVALFWKAGVEIVEGRIPDPSVLVSDLHHQVFSPVSGADDALIDQNNLRLSNRLELINRSGLDSQYREQQFRNNTMAQSFPR